MIGQMISQNKELEEEVDCLKQNVKYLERVKIDLERKLRQLNRNIEEFITRDDNPESKREKDMNSCARSIYCEPLERFNIHVRRRIGRVVRDMHEYIMVYHKDMKIEDIKIEGKCAKYLTEAIGDEHFDGEEHFDNFDGYDVCRLISYLIDVQNELLKHSTTSHNKIQGMLKGLHDVENYLYQAIIDDERHNLCNEDGDMNFHKLKEALSDLACGRKRFDYTYKLDEDEE